MKKKSNKLMFLSLMCVILLTYKANASEIFSTVCPLCTIDGEITCPVGYKAACENVPPNDSKPKCLFYGMNYVPGCWQFIGIMSIDFSLLPANMPPSTMIKIIGGGEVYTLNRETIGCKKL